MRKKMERFLLFGMVALVISFGLNDLTFAKSEKIVWKAQSTWSAGPGHQESAIYFAERVNKTSGGRLTIKMHSAGEIVGAFQSFDATCKGVLDLSIGTGLYLEGKIPGASLFCGTAASPLENREEKLIWEYEEGGNELYNKVLKDRGFNVIRYPGNLILPAEPLWTKKPINSLKDFKGLKVRASGWSMLVYKKMGASTMMMSLGDTIPALEKGVMDAAEFCVPYTDYPAGIHEICGYMYTGTNHQPTIIGDTFINRDSWKSLPDDLKELVKMALRDSQYWYFYHISYKNMNLFKKIKESGVKIERFNDEIQNRFKEVGKEIAAEKSNIPFVAEALKSQNKVHDIASPYRKKMGW